ncbi:MAG: hypothetical protein GXO19_05845 [Epsilonproteobacteria bacterium]|nr:hypothetical protein [Campylobacterota bacterium]NPA57239.1 hypothetical protein [Campylobacterota bacterium]
MDYELRQTGDGSYTLYSTSFDECYHSVKDGALREALYKHVLPAFDLVQKGKVRILDICFGLGINTLATLYWLERLPQIERVEIFSPEMDRELLNLLPTFPYPQELAPYRPLIEELVTTGSYGDGRVSIELFKGDAREYVRGLEAIDIVYQDPFSPKRNPILWTLEFFRDLHRIMDDSGILTTYSVATPVRLGLYEAGFSIYEAPKKIGVRPGTIASKGPLPLNQIDMEAKRRRSSAKVLRDDEVVDPTYNLPRSNDQT